MEGTANTFGTQDIITGRGLGIGGFGYGYGMAHGPYAGPGSNAVRINRNSQQIEDQADCTRQLFGQAFNSIQGSFENATRAGEFNRICERLTEIDRRNTDNQFRSELRLNDQVAAVREQQAKDAAAQALCCCKLEAQAEANKAELKADIKDLEVSRLKDDLATARNQLNVQATVASVSASCGCCGGSTNCNS